jgi:peroxiredoxin
MDPMDIDAVAGNRKTRLWIDRDQHLIRREVCSGASSDNPSGKEFLTQTVTFNLVEANKALEAGIFQLSLPPGARELHQSPLSEAQNAFPTGVLPRAFEYELPFIAMSHFRLPGIDGEELALSRYEGKFVLLDFWATWCVPCHQQSADLVKIIRQYEGKDMAVLGLSSEPLERARAFFKKRSQGYPMLIDEGGKLASLFGIDVLPTLILLDRSGKLILKREGRLTYNEIRALLNDAGLK